MSGLSAPYTSWRVQVFYLAVHASWWWCCQQRETLPGGRRAYGQCGDGPAIRGGFWTPALARKAALVHIREAHRCPGQWERDAAGWWTLVTANAQEANLDDAAPRGLRYGPRAPTVEP